MECINCLEELVWEDSFGNLDHCLDSIGHPRSEGSRIRKPVKKGDIYHCNSCEIYYHVHAGSNILNEGYPC